MQYLSKQTGRHLRQQVSRNDQDRPGLIVRRGEYSELLITAFTFFQIIFTRIEELIASAREGASLLSHHPGEKRAVAPDDEVNFGAFRILEPIIFSFQFVDGIDKEIDAAIPTLSDLQPILKPGVPVASHQTAIRENTRRLYTGRPFRAVEQVGIATVAVALVGIIENDPPHGRHIVVR